ncbi:hypothetical protein L1887_58544 [Cichorium endivia]|nr:hypothetical protein L1887_58544 [Cichorium endivia]
MSRSFPFAKFGAQNKQAASPALISMFRDDDAVAESHSRECHAQSRRFSQSSGILRKLLATKNSLMIDAWKNNFGLSGSSEPNQVLFWTFRFCFECPFELDWSPVTGAQKFKSSTKKSVQIVSLTASSIDSTTRWNCPLERCKLSVSCRETLQRTHIFDDFTEQDKEQY